MPGGLPAPPGHNEIVPAARILALDVGLRRIGLAVSDPLGLTAQGLETLERQNEAADLNALSQLARHYEIRTFLLGLPRRLSGEEGAQAAKVRAFGARLARRTGLPVAYWDERLTTVEAERVLRQGGLSRREQRRPAVDRLAAVILLQSFLESGTIPV